ncbi:MAG: RNA-binding protein [Candidatus Sedimenticola sp. PURPLELP]
MEIFLRRLPEKVSRLDLLRFVAPAIHQNSAIPVTTPRAEISNCEIIQVTNLSTGKTEFHGLAKIEPAAAALTAIECLNGHELNGANIEVRQFYRRSPFRDQRLDVSHILPPEIMEKRKGDRRRSGLKVEILHAGSSQFVVSNDQPIT